MDGGAGVSRRRRHRRLRRAVLGAIVALLGLAAAGAAAQGPAGLADVLDAAQGRVVADPGTIVDPGATVPGSPQAPPVTSPGTATVPGGPSPVGGDETGGGDDAVRSGRAARREPGYASAAAQSPQAKRAEASRCVDIDRRTSSMLALGGSAAADRGGPWGTLALIIGVAALAVAGGASMLRRGSDTKLLEQVGVLVGILGVIGRLAVQFVPGAAAGADRPRAAAMAVRDVQAGVTRGEFARKTNATRRFAREDAAEIGNVVWLEVHLESYAEREPWLQHGSYDLDAGGALLPGTAKEVELRTRGADVETLFVPIWVGRPKSRRFEVGFRLIEENLVQGLAATQKMKGLRYRYACDART